MVTDSLINWTDYGHIYDNILTETSIVGLEGTLYSYNKGLNIKQDEIKKLTDFFQAEIKCYSINYIKSK